MMRYAKFLVAFLIPVAQAAQAAISDGTITDDEWWKIGIAAILATGVFAVPNKQPAPTKVDQAPPKG